MFERILFPTDGSAGAERALDHAIDLAVAHDATLHLLHVADTGRDSVLQIQGDVVDVLEREGERLLEGAAEAAGDRHVRTETEVLQGEPYRTIADYADSREVDLVVMPTHGRTGLERYLLGSTTERVVRRCEPPVLTIRPDGEVSYPYNAVLAPTDGSDPADAALSTGIDVALAEDGALHVLSVVDVGGLGPDVRSGVGDADREADARTVVDEAGAAATDAGVDPVTTAVERAASIPRAIVEYARANDVGLVVVGTHGRTGVDRYLLGSVAEQLVRTSPVPVLTVRPAREED